MKPYKEKINQLTIIFLLMFITYDLLQHAPQICRDIRHGWNDRINQLEPRY
jgi:hypothetical protein